MGRTDFLFELIQTRNAAAAVALIALVIGSRALLRERRSGWLVLCFAALVVALGYALSRR
jgi:hypothetical protein